MIGHPQQVISDLDTSMGIPPQNQSQQSLQALLNNTLANIRQLNETLESRGIDDGMIISKGFVLDPSDSIVGGIAGTEEFDGEPQVVNQTK